MSVLVVASVIAAGVGPDRAVVPAVAQIMYNPSNADYVTIQRMQTAGQFLRGYFAKNGHLPQTPQEVDGALSALADDDPSSGSPPKEPNTKGYFRMYLDPSINPALGEQWKRSPPGSWQAPLNGIVTIIVGGDNYYLIWGSGMNFGPILDPNNGKAILVTGQLGQDAP